MVAFWLDVVQACKLMAGCMGSPMPVSVANRGIASDSLGVVVTLWMSRKGPWWLGTIRKGRCLAGGTRLYGQGEFAGVCPLGQDNKGGRLFSSPSIGGCEFV